MLAVQLTTRQGAPVGSDACLGVDAVRGRRVHPLPGLERCICGGAPPLGPPLPTLMRAGPPTLFHTHELHSPHPSSQAGCAEVTTRWAPRTARCWCSAPAPAAPASRWPCSPQAACSPAPSLSDMQASPACVACTAARAVAGSRVGGPASLQAQRPSNGEHAAAVSSPCLTLAYFTTASP